MVMRNVLSFCLLMILTWVSNPTNAQNPVVFKINGESVYLDEFETIFRKNNTEKQTTRKEVEEYLDLYIKFKMKVKEAEALGLDTTKAFRDELAQYREQLARPYLTDTATNESLLKEAYDRMLKEVKAAHILIRIDENASPKDTIEAYKKISDIRKKVLAGEDFNKLAKTMSEDPSAKDNGGDLGYFSSMRMIYAFENVAFNTPKGKTSEVFRTRFGYHILKVEDIRDARGEVQVAHIMVAMKKEDPDSLKRSAERKINEIYKQLKTGANFEELAKQFSDDIGTKQNGGNLPAFGSGRMVPEFENAAFALAKNGDISEPFQTMYGWHIAKRIDRKPVPSYADARADLQNKIARDDRAFLNRKNFVARLKKDYKFVEYPKTRNDFFNTVDTNLLSGTWEIGKMNKSAIPLFTLDGQNYLVSDFANYVEANQTPGQKDVQITLGKMYDQFVEEKVIAYENSKLEAKHPAFRNLMKEYREGILLFELTDKTVWSKAVTDTDGLEAFYQKNKMKYMWGDRINATFYHNNTEAIAKQTLKLAKKKKNTSEVILETVNKDNPLNLRITSGKYDKNATTEPVNDFEWKKGFSSIKKVNNEFVFVNIIEVLAPQPKELNEIKGLVTSDYQEYLEGVWLEELNKKYKVEVNPAALNEIK